MLSSHKALMSPVVMKARSPVGLPNSWNMNVIAPCSCDGQHGSTSFVASSLSHPVSPEARRPSGHFGGRLLERISLLGSWAGSPDVVKKLSWSQTRVAHSVISVMLNVSGAQPVVGHRPDCSSKRAQSSKKEYIRLAGLGPSRIPVLRKCSRGPGGSPPPTVFMRKTLSSGSAPPM